MSPRLGVCEPSGSSAVRSRTLTLIGASVISYV